MSCGDISANIAFDCLKSQGGLNRVWLANWVEGGVTSLAGVGTGLSSNLTTVYEYAITGNVHNFTETKSSNKDTGTSGTAQVVALTITKTSAEKTAQLNLLSSGRVILFLEDNNKNIHALGLWKGMYFEVVKQSGTGTADTNGYVLNGTADAEELSPILDETTKTALLALVA